VDHRTTPDPLSGLWRDNHTYKTGRQYHSHLQSRRKVREPRINKLPISFKYSRVYSLCASKNLLIGIRAPDPSTAEVPVWARPRAMQVGLASSAKAIHLRPELAEIVPSPAAADENPILPQPGEVFFDFDKGDRAGVQ